MESTRRLKKQARRITSLLEYVQYFGYPDPEKESLSVTFTADGKVNATVDESKRSKFLMYYSLQTFFDNGGGPCWINSVGDYTSTGGSIVAQDLLNGLAQIEKINEVTLLVFPDSMNLDNAVDYYNIHDKAIEQCVKLQDRFTVMDVYHVADNLDVWDFDINGAGGEGGLRNILSGTTDDLKYAAVYFPRIYASIDFNYKTDPNDQTKDNDAAIKIIGAGADNLAALKSTDNAKYFQAKNALTNLEMLLPVSSAMVGIYAQVDNARGVWKAPANVNIDDAIRPQYLITKEEQATLNVDPVAGKSINVIRSFEGRGPAIVWGARTLAGNDNEWRYIPVRRYFNMVEESTKNASEQFVFEPNDINTWVRVKSMIANYFTQQWKAGALMGASTKEAFFVHIGLGETMTEQDIFEGRMIIEIGLAVVRPAEFIILRFMHKMLAES
ncbi:MAG: phage tail sheath C-terminal domain-containing protein [Agriterribacter sp.]